MTRDGVNGEPRLRRRAMREDVRRARVAIELVQPWAGEIGSWQRDAARLLGEAERARLQRMDGSETGTRIGALLQKIALARNDLQARLAGAPTEILRHNRVVDVRRSMDSALASLDHARSMLT
jgi:hypothetical protein